jgi:hypothetical protein
MTNPTAPASGCPRFEIGDTHDKPIFARPAQPTFGRLVSICQEAARAFQNMSLAALMPMMVDDDAHFHALSRPREGQGAFAAPTRSLA